MNDTGGALELSRFIEQIKPRLRFMRIQWVPELGDTQLGFDDDLPDRLLAGRYVFDGLVKRGFEVAGDPPPPWARRHELDPRTGAEWRALDAVAERLSPDHRGMLETCPDPELMFRLAQVVVEGAATVEQTAEAWARMMELSDAEEAGELTHEQALALIVCVSERQVGERDGGGGGAD